MVHIIKFYPVDNADCTLVKLSNGKTIVIDSQIRNAYDDKGNQQSFDIKADLLSELNKDADGHPYVDLFINTHPHKDHCIGFGENFYHGDINNYDDENNETIVIGEMWVTHRAMGNYVDESAVDIRKEAKRRKKLYDDNADFEGSYGNYLRIIGYDGDKEYDNRYNYIPGTLVNNINGELLKFLEIFIHAPFKDDIENCKNEDDKNATSIVIQLGFKYEENGAVEKKVLLGGDAEYQIWQHIVERNKQDERLDWHIFQAPHHCSWTFFNDPGKEDVLQTSIDILNHQIGKDSYIISSSQEILDDKNNPPCYAAKKEYEKHLKTKKNFLNTATYKEVDGIPQPIVLRLLKSTISLREGVLDAYEAKQFSSSLRNGSLKVSATGILSTTSGMAVAASKGFYGEKKEE